MNINSSYIILLARASDYSHDGVPEDIVDSIISMQERMREVDIQAIRHQVLKGLDDFEQEQLELFLEFIDQTTVEMDASIEEELTAIRDDMEEYMQ